VTAVLEMAAASGIGLFLGIVLMATYAAAAISHCQQHMQRKVREAQAEAASAREYANLHVDRYDRLPL
jgi:hypothetical protein